MEWSYVFILILILIVVIVTIYLMRRKTSGGNEDKPAKISSKFFGPKVNREKLQFTSVSEYSVTPYDGTLALKTIIEKRFINRGMIVDSTANVGGDTNTFATYFGKVISVEKDKSAFEALQNNVKEFGHKNIEAINDSCFAVLDPKNKYKSTVEDADIIYVDPPWGGRDYKQKNNIRLPMDDGKECLDLMKLAPDRTFIYKLPRNYDFNAFSEYKDRATEKIVIWKVYRKMGPGGVSTQTAYPFYAICIAYSKQFSKDKPRFKEITEEDGVMYCCD